MSRALEEVANYYRFNLRVFPAKSSMILKTFDNDVLEPKNDLWGHRFEVSHCSKAEEVLGTLPVKYNVFQPLRYHHALHATSSPPASEIATI